MTIAGNQGQNVYPAPDNYPVTSFPQPVPPPSVDPDDEGTLILVKYSWEWQQVLLAAVDQLLNPATWQGSHDEIITALNRAVGLKSLLAQDTVEEVPTPFWDEESGDDSDDIAPINDQPWYGQLVLVDDRLTFVENAFIYVVAGFIAYAGLPTAAISFVPLARQFVVTAKSNPLGGIVRFLADSVEIGRVDTYSATDGVIQTPLAMPPPVTGFLAETTTTYPTLWVELLPDNPHDLASVSMTIIRSRLSEADYSDPAYRYDATCDCVQYSPDGGSTWIDATGNDPRHAPQFLKPPVAGTNKKCDAAANKVKWLHDFIDQTLAAFSVGAIAVTVLNILFTFTEILFPPSALVQLLVDTAGTIFGIGETALTGAFTSDQYDLLLCIFFCNADTDGLVSADQLATIEGEVTAKLNTTAALVVNLLLATQGEIGLSNAGSTGTQTGDCTACECCPGDFAWCATIVDPAANNDGGFVAFYDPTPPDGWNAPWALYGFDSGVSEWCWQQNTIGRSSGVEVARAMRMSKTLPSGHYRHLEIDYTVAFGTWVPSDFRSFVFKMDGVEFLNITADGTGTATWDGDVTGTPVIEINTLESYHNNGVDGGGGARMFRVFLEGDGARPSF